MPRHNSLIFTATRLQHERDKRHTYQAENNREMRKQFWSQNAKEDGFGDLGVDGRIVLKQIVQNLSEMN
jgi:hypothetical protein